MVCVLVVVVCNGVVEEEIFDDVVSGFGGVDVVFCEGESDWGEVLCES